MKRAIFLIGVSIAAWGADTDLRQNAWTTLDTAMQSGNPEHRLQALAAIGTISNTDERAVKTAETALQDKDALVRVAAANALGQMKATQAAPALKAVVDSDTGEVAFAAAKALCNMGDPAGREMLVAVLAGERKDTPGMLTNAVRDARKKMRHPEGLLLMGTQDATGALFGPASMGIVAVKDAFKMRGVSGRASAAQALANDPEPYAVQLLEWALTDNNWEVRASAAKALGERGTADSLPKLQTALADSRDAVRTLSAASILRIEDRQAGATASANNR